LFQESENEKMERIARHLIQRFPQGVPTYLSIREVSHLKDNGEYTTNYASTSKTPAITISKEDSTTRRSPMLSKVYGYGSSPRPPTKSFPDPRQIINTPSSDTDSEDEDENSYGNQFTSVIQALKSKFSSSSDYASCKSPLSPDYDDVKGSDSAPADDDESVKRQPSFDFVHDDKALRDDLKEVFIFCLFKE
jgi:hypothetical protein